MLRDVALWLRPEWWPLLPDGERRRTRLLAYAAMVAQLVFVGGWVVGGALEPHYSQTRQYISELGRDGAAHPWIFTLFVGLWGLGFVALGVAIVPSLRTRPWPLAMPAMFVLAGVCAVAVGWLHMDCGPTVSAVCKSREAAGALSWHHYAHEWVSLAIKLALLLTGFTFARSAWPSRLGRWVLNGALVLLVAGIVTFFMHDSFAGHQGLEERVWALVAMLWALLCAGVLILEATLRPEVWRSHQTSRRRQSPGEPAAIGVDPA